MSTGVATPWANETLEMQRVLRAMMGIRVVLVVLILLDVAPARRRDLTRDGSIAK